MTVLSVVKGNNAELIAEVAKLWIDGENDRCLDVTYGRGLWWTKFRPRFLDTNDLDPNTDAAYRDDFTDLHFGSIYDVVAFDPPYVSKGGRDTSGIKEMDARYGLYEAPKDPQALWAWIGDGIGSCAHLLKPRGRLLVKCSDFISSGKYQQGLHWVTTLAQAAGLEQVDLFIHHSGTGPQPKTNRDGTPRRQVHSRRAHSYLVVFQK